MSERGERLAKLFLAHRSVTEDIARRLPDDRGDFKPWPGAMSATELLVHMATAHHTILGIARGQGVQRPDAASLPKDPPAVRRLLAELTEADAAALRAVTDAELAAAVKGFRDVTMPGEAWVVVAREHEIHHKGQLFTYLRIMGVEPPPSLANRG